MVWHGALGEVGTSLTQLCLPQCPSRTFGTFSSTKDFPDEVIQFARHHPLMYNPVLPHGQRPLFLQAGVPHTFTRIAVDRVAAADGHYDVLFIGTGTWHPRSGAEGWGCPRPPPHQPPCRCGHRAEGGLGTAAELARHGAAAAGGAAGLPGESLRWGLRTSRALPVTANLALLQDASPIASLQLSSKRVRRRGPSPAGPTGPIAGVLSPLSLQQQLYAGSATAVAQLPLHRCGAYGKACAECCLARDPYCAWDGTACTRFVPSTKRYVALGPRARGRERAVQPSPLRRRSRRQDVRNGDPNLLCSEGAWGRGARCRARSGETTDAGCRPAEPSQGRVPQRQLYGVEGSSAFLECVPRSLRARVAWTYQRGPDAPQREVGAARRGGGRSRPRALTAARV